MTTTKWKRVQVRAHVLRVAVCESTTLDDPRIEWVREQAMRCVAEGMSPYEAVEGARVIVFARHHGQPPADGQ